MIQNILELLPYVKDGSENIRIAKGQNYLPKNLKQAFKPNLKTIWNGNQKNSHS